MLRLWLSYSTGGFDIRCWFDSVKILSSSNFSEFYRFAYPRPAEYEYPPIWMFILSIVGSGYRLGWYASELSPIFRFLVKFPIIVSDILVSLVIFLQIRRWRRDEDSALVPAVVWLFNPFVIYISSIQGMFDSICILFLLLTVYDLEKDSFVRGGLWFGLALLTKQYAYLAVPPLCAVLLKRRVFRGVFLFLATSASLFFVFSLPFLLGSPSEYIASIGMASRLETSLCTRYQHYEGFFFSGIWYLLDKAFHLPSDTFYLYKPAIASSMALFTALCYLNSDRETALNDTLLGSNMVFTLVGLMINSQYLVFPMAFSAVNIGIHRRNYAWFIPEAILSTYFPLRTLDYAPIGVRTYGLLIAFTVVGWALTHLVKACSVPNMAFLRLQIHKVLDSKVQ
ncbi:MAG: DUF2029 domain-containing protein [Candidatus Bathyarchaeota archaeon]|nr:MAG: DUF2029 domain-containing protein [Candidatus Bathyarchaeota archaeon]